MHGPETSVRNTAYSACHNNNNQVIDNNQVILSIARFRQRNRVPPSYAALTTIFGDEEGKMSRG